MKDYYYILGIAQDATDEEIKSSYRKLSMKFHPDKNDGDEFFMNRFKDIQEAYETLINPLKRKIYDSKKNAKTNIDYSTETNFQPYIESFSTDKDYIAFDEEIVFKWKTINANNVRIIPFGKVEPIGQKTFKIKDFRTPYFKFEIIANNSLIERSSNKEIILKNQTYEELYKHFLKKIRDEDDASNKIKQGQHEKSHNEFRKTKPEPKHINVEMKFSDFLSIQMLLVLVFVAFILFFLYDYNN